MIFSKAIFVLPTHQTTKYYLNCFRWNSFLQCLSDLVNVIKLYVIFFTVVTGEKGNRFLPK
jgi:hypothetical protein